MHNVCCVQVDIRRTMNISPLCTVLPSGIEHLDAVVLAITHIERTLRVDPQAMGQMKFPGPGLPRRSS